MSNLIWLIGRRWVGQRELNQDVICYTYVGRRMIFALSLSTWSDQRKHAAIFCGWEKLTQNAFSPGHSLPVLIYFRYEELKDFHNKPRRIKINGVHCESTQVSRKFPGRSAAWENARSLATDGKAEQCRLPMFLSGLVKTKHLEELQKQSGRVAQTPKEWLKDFVYI